MNVRSSLLAFRFSAVSCAVTASVAIGCGSQQPPDKTFVRGARHADVELPQFEVHSDGIDRFTTCPPSGSATQGWVPKVAAFSGPSAAPAAPKPASDAGVSAFDAEAPNLEGEISVQKREDDPANAPTATEKAIRDTLRPFRACYRRGTLMRVGAFRDEAAREVAVRDSHVAIVVRVGSDGRVVKTESYGACELSRETISCMLQVGKRLRFDPPADGNAATIILPAMFAGSTAGVSRNPTGAYDDYAAAAAVVFENARPDLHACEQAARKAVRSPNGWGTFVIDIDATGKAVRQNIDPWDGKNQPLLQCASDAVARLSFPTPPGGSATVRVRVVFNRGESD